jgi:hypothetical protein
LADGFHVFAGGTPASKTFRIAMICSSWNLDFRIPISPA